MEGEFAALCSIVIVVHMSSVQVVPTHGVLPGCIAFISHWNMLYALRYCSFYKLLKASFDKLVLCTASDLYCLKVGCFSLVQIDPLMEVPRHNFDCDNLSRPFLDDPERRISQ